MKVECHYLYTSLCTDNKSEDLVIVQCDKAVAGKLVKPITGNYFC